MPRTHDAPARSAPPGLLEVVTPRTNATPISAAARMLAACAGQHTFSLEIAGAAEGPRFLVRGGDALASLQRQLAATYPQAELRDFAAERHPALDPAWLGDAEQVASCALVLRAAPCLPLRTFRDADVAGDRAPQADPVLALLGAAGGLPPGWRVLSQLVLGPAPAGWGESYQRLALDRPPPTVASRSPGPSGGAIAAMGGLVAILAAGPLGWQWYVAGDWLRLGLAAGGLAVALPAALAIKRGLAERPPVDPALVRDKLAHSAYLAQLRLAVFAPAAAAADELLARLDGLAAAYGQFALPAGNAFRPRPIRIECDALRGVAPLRAARPRWLGWLPGGGATALLNVHELAGLWHLPPAQADVPLLERTTARRWAPLPASVAEGCRIGVTEGPGAPTPVALDEELLRRHLLLVAKTRRGKSSLLLHLARHVMARADPAGPALVLVDPHRDLARAALGLVPPHRRDAVVYLDVADHDRPVGLNLLDVGLGWPADRAVANALAVFRHQWDEFWGPRMEDIFRMVLHTLYAANAARCAADPAARASQYTILEIPLLLADPAFRRRVVEVGRDQVVAEWWRTFFDRLLDRRLQLESINPVLTKINRLAASAASRGLLGQPCSTIAPAEWLREGKLVIVHTAQGDDADTAALVGGTVLNLLALEVRAQAALPPARRRAVTVVVDEFHTLPAAEYEAFLAELPKYGAALVLATQTLARLEALDRDHRRSLRATLFSNLDGLFAFHCSAEDAAYLVPELGGGLEVDDLVALGEHRCYARLSVRRERLPVFSVRLDPPPRADEALAAALAAASARRYGRPRDLVERVRTALHEQIDAIHQAIAAEARAAHATAEPPPPLHGIDGAVAAEPRREARNQHRRRRAAGPDAPAQQPRLLDASAADEDDGLELELEAGDRAE